MALSSTSPEVLALLKLATAPFLVLRKQLLDVETRLMTPAGLLPLPHLVQRRPHPPISFQSLPINIDSIRFNGHPLKGSFHKINMSCVIKLLSFIGF
jgi:hypothetical protein